MNKKLKIISIFALVLAITIILTSSCFASQPDNLITTQNAKSYYDVAKKYAESNNINFVDYLICSNGYVYLFKDNYSCFVYDGCISADKVLIFEFKGEPSDDVNPVVDGNSSSRVAYTEANKIIYSSFDVKQQGTEELVFQKTPVEKALETTLAPIVQEAPLEETIKEIVGILPIVLIIVVGLIGLRKGLALLSQTLHRA